MGVTARAWLVYQRVGAGHLTGGSAHPPVHLAPAAGTLADSGGLE